MISRYEAAKREAEKRRAVGFYKSRYGIVMEARSATIPQAPELYDPTKHLPPMPKGYGAYRESSEWRHHELDFRRKHASTCDDCHLFRRCDVFHTSATHITPHDDAYLTLLCPVCHHKRIPLKPTTVKIKNLHTQTTARQANKMPLFTLESTSCGESD